MSLLELFCAVDDCCQAFEPKWQQTLFSQGLRQRRRQSKLCLSERMTIIIHFHQPGYRTFKQYYDEHVCRYLRTEFPGLVSYTRFVELMPQTFNVHLLTFARVNMKGRLLHQEDVFLLRKRAIIETINDQLKNISQVEHSRHRSPLNFVVNLLAGLIAYCLQPKKPWLHLDAPPLLTAA